MSEHTFHSSGPVRAETLLVGAWAESSLGRRFITEEREVLWLRQDETRYGYYWDGKLFRSEHTLNDHCGPLTSFSANDALKMTAALALTPADRLEVRAVCRVDETPVERVSEQPYYGRYEYRALKQFFTGTPEELARVAAYRYDNDKWQEGDWMPGDALLRARVLAEAVVWSSKRTEAENAAALAEFLASFTEEQL